MFWRVHQKIRKKNKETKLVIVRIDKSGYWMQLLKYWVKAALKERKTHFGYFNHATLVVRRIWIKKAYRTRRNSRNAFLRERVQWLERQANILPGLAESSVLAELLFASQNEHALICGVNLEICRVDAIILCFKNWFSLMVILSFFSHNCFWHEYLSGNSEARVLEEKNKIFREF